ncbi:MAG: SprB repeat-containing protein [Bacteroidetes bacterium]|nr:SprB repeat-containing protein [Bacteroidota bacterium]
MDADITLTEPELLELQAVVFTYPNGYNVSLYNAYNGSITVTVNGGVANYNLLWNDGNTNQNRTALGASSYRVTVTDANGCVANIEQLILTQPERSDWTMTGNANTNPATNFIGTTDLKDLVFKTNNLERLKINANGDLKINNMVGKSGTLQIDATGLLYSSNMDGVLAPCNTIIKSEWLNLSSPLTLFTCLPVKVGIGTYTPQSLTAIAGNLSVGFVYAPNFAAPTNGMIVQGNVGIGTSTVDPNIQLTISSANDALACIGTTNAAGANVGLLLKGDLMDGIALS